MTHNQMQFFFASQSKILLFLILILYSKFFRFKYKNLTSIMSLDEIKEKYNSGKDQSSEAFDELCALVETMEVGQVFAYLLVVMSFFI